MKILIVTLQHGNEVFGKKVVDNYKNSNIDTIIANPKAYKEKKRFIETDMNRSFRRNPAKSYEEKRAHKLLEIAQEYDFVIDIHTTTSNVEFVPIIANTTSLIHTALSHLPSEEVALMAFNGVKNSLIGNVPNSISLEFNEDYAGQEVSMDIIRDLVDGIMSRITGQYTRKEIFEIKGTIPATMKIDKDEENFKLSSRYGFYPFLLGEKNYRDYQGFFANKKKSIKIQT